MCVIVSKSVSAKEHPVVTWYLLLDSLINDDDVPRVTKLNWIVHQVPGPGGAQVLMNECHADTVTAVVML